MTSEVTWCIERGIFPDTQDEMVDAIRSLGQKVIFWRENLRGLESEKVVFHGSLGIANDIATRGIWVTQIDEEGNFLVHGKNSDESFEWCELNGITNDDVMRAVHSRKMF